MSFAQNLVYIRQHYRVTQETIADQLGVSRQTVSKWEAGINFPETDKLLLLCDLYHTNLDDLMRGSVKIANVKDTELYDAHMNRFARSIVTGVALFFCGVAVLMILEGISFNHNAAAAVMLSFVVVGALIMIVAGLNHSEFKRKNPNIEPSYSEEVLNRFGKRFPVLIASGIGIILLDVIMLVALSPENKGIVELQDLPFSFVLALSVFMLFVALGAGIVIYAGMQKSKYDKTEFTYVTEDRNTAQRTGNLSSSDVTFGEYRRNRIIGALCTAIMLTALVVFLVLGFSLSDYPFGSGFPFEGTWQESGFAYSWIAFPVGGILCAVVALIVNTFYRSKEELIAEARKENPWVKVNKSDETPED